MIFVDKTERNGLIHIDGYSNAKTVNGALKDLAREVAKVSELEASVITDAIKFGDEVCVDTEYYKVECEEVGCASRFVDEEAMECEYRPANFYLHIMFVR